MSHILHSAINDRRTLLINKLNKCGYDSLERLTRYTLSELEAAQISHLSNLGRIMTRQLLEESSVNEHL